MTFVRIWRTGLDLERLAEYDRFVEERSRSMFHAQRGFLGVVYTRSEDRVAVLSFWQDRAAVDALDVSKSYQDAVRTIEASGFLRGSASLEVYEIHEGALAEPSILLGSTTRKAPP